MRYTAALCLQAILVLVGCGGSSGPDAEAEAEAATVDVLAALPDIIDTGSVDASVDQDVGHDVVMPTDVDQPVDVYVAPPPPSDAGPCGGPCPWNPTDGVYETCIAGACVVCGYSTSEMEEPCCAGDDPCPMVGPPGVSACVSGRCGCIPGYTLTGDGCQH